MAPDSAAREPRRRCLASGRVRPRGELVRFAVEDDGRIEPDVAGRRGGRGLWLSPGRDMIETAAARNLFARAARRKVVLASAPLAGAAAVDDLASRTEAALLRRCLDLVGLARRRGQAVAGKDNVDRWLAAGKASLSVEAVDCTDFDRVAVAPGPFAERLVREAERLAGFGRKLIVRRVD